MAVLYFHYFLRSSSGYLQVILRLLVSMHTMLILYKPWEWHVSQQKRHKFVTLYVYRPGK